MLEGYKKKSFDENSWSDVEPFLPNDVVVRSVILDDLMWFVSRPKKYKNAQQKADDYIRHLRLKSDERFGRFQNHADVFRIIDVDKIESHLKSLYQ